MQYINTPSESGLLSSQTDKDIQFLSCYLMEAKILELFLSSVKPCTIVHFLNQRQNADHAIDHLLQNQMLSYHHEGEPERQTDQCEAERKSFKEK